MFVKIPHLLDDIVYDGFFGKNDIATLDLAFEIAAGTQVGISSRGCQRSITYCVIRRRLFSPTRREKSGKESRRPVQ